MTDLTNPSEPVAPISTTGVSVATALPASDVHPLEKHKESFLERVKDGVIVDTEELWAWIKSIV